MHRPAASARLILQLLRVSWLDTRRSCSMNRWEWLRPGISLLSRSLLPSNTLLAGQQPNGRVRRWVPTG